MDAQTAYRRKRLIAQMLHFVLHFLCRQYFGPEWMRHLSQYCMRLPVIQSHFVLACLANFVVVFCLVQTPSVVMKLIEGFTIWIIRISRLIRVTVINRR